MFYKKIEGDLLKGENISSPVVTLKAEDKDNYIYPQDGWYWFDTFDEALAFFADQSKGSITMRQARLALLGEGLLTTVDEAIANSTDEVLKVEWEYATEVRRDWSNLIAMATSLGMTEEQLDDLFIKASKL